MDIATSEGSLTKEVLIDSLLTVYNMGPEFRQAPEPYLVKEGLIVKSLLNDLAKKGGLEENDLNCLYSVYAHNGGGLYKGWPFTLSFVKDQILLVSMINDDEDSKRLVEALSSVVGYRPFCKYTASREGGVTYEWAKNDLKERYQDLIREGKRDLIFLDEWPL
jgi:hypothetical protein